MNLLEQKQREIDALKSKLKIQEQKIASLEKQNQWYIEQFKLRQHQKFGTSSERADKDQISIADVFSDVFNEAEVLKEPITVEPDADVVIPTHKRKKLKEVQSSKTFLLKPSHMNFLKTKKYVRLVVNP